MSVDGLSGATTPAAIEAERTALVLRKQRDVVEAQAEAMIQLVREAAKAGTGRLIDVRA